MSMTHREALRAAKMATGVRPYGDIEAFLRAYIEARGLVLVPKKNDVLRDSIAKAMCEADGFPWDAGSVNDTANGEEPDQQREYWRDKADAALLAIHYAAAPDPFAEGE